MAHAGLPRPKVRTIEKSLLLSQLAAVDSDNESRSRVLSLETLFRSIVNIHLGSLPTQKAKFQKFNTSPFVLMMYCLQQSYSRISEIEHDILPAKLFSSMETSAGRMVEKVTLPAYGWEIVESGMHTANSALDGKCHTKDVLKLATLKSGPRCLNDEMSENFADAILNHAITWATDADVKRVEFTYGVLYGTQKQSNKKDWHILRNIEEKIYRSNGEITVSPHKRWNCTFSKDNIDVNVSIRIGIDWWTYLGGTNCFIELCIALIRACVSPGDSDPEKQTYTIADLEDIVSTDIVPNDFNVSVLQQSQLEWLFFLARHFCDDLRNN